MKAKLEIMGSMAAFGTIGDLWGDTYPAVRRLALYRALIAAGAVFSSLAAETAAARGRDKERMQRQSCTLLILSGGGHWNQLDTVFEA